MSRRLELTGQKFGRLTVVEYSHTCKRRAYWLCKCDCGNEKIIQTSSLKSGFTRSCGCLQKERASEATRLPEGIAARNQVLYVHKRNAKLKNLVQTLTDEQIIAIHKENCHYCGAPPSKAQKSRNGPYIYNGLDRKNNNKGYTLDNVVPCCWECNYFKKARPYDEFLDKIKRIHSHLDL